MNSKTKQSQTCFSEKINNIEKSFTRLSMKKMEKTHITKIENKMATTVKEINRIIREYHKQLYTKIRLLREIKTRNT